MNELTDVELRQIEGRWKSDMDLKVDRVDARVRTIERLVWVATGGVAVLGVVSAVGLGILSGFASRLDGFSSRLEVVSTAQAVALTEYRLNEEQARQKIAELQRQVERMRERK